MSTMHMMNTDILVPIPYPTPQLVHMLSFLLLLLKSVLISELAT